MSKILIASHVSLFPPEHGGAKSLRSVAESLAAAGAEVTVLVKLHPPLPERLRFLGQFVPDLESRGFSPAGWTHAGVRYRGVAGPLDAAAAEALSRGRPDAFLLCDDSPEDARALFRLAADSGRLLFLAQTVHALPFGPFSIKPDAELSESLRRAAGIVSPSRHVQGYIREHLGRESALWLPDVLGAPPFAELGRRDNEFVAMINPCAWKGSSIFLKLAARRPELRFAAVPTWGATPATLAALKALPNVTLLPETPRIDEIFARTRVLLVPSLCQEAFGLVSPEALLRGVPVIASDLGGLRESTLGAAELVPVKPLPFDKPLDRPFPEMDWSEPDNDVEPWSAALDRALASEEEYRARSRAGREAAHRFLRGLERRSALELLPRPARLRDLSLELS